ncbi:MAG: TolC family protein [Kiritimatiellaceae bacterium]|nr:TolC family protein [Kiritimatiellaceae bacterium]
MKQKFYRNTGAFIALTLAVLGAGLPARAQVEPGSVLDLRQALELALAHSPELTASSHGVLAAEGTARQAGALPNPRLELQASEFGGSGIRSGYSGAETSVQLSQSIELGGKRGKRQRVAQAEARLTGWDYEAKRLDVLAQTKKSFVDVLLAQGRLALTESLLTVAEDVRTAAAQRVRSGKVAPLEETKAGVELAAARIALDRAKRELDTARKRLAASWGGTVPVFTEAAGDLSAVSDIPSMEKLFALLGNTPEIAREREVLTSGRESLALAKAERIPDIEISAGVSRFEEDGSTAGIVGLSIPLPLFDRNAGGIFAAKHQALRAEYEQRAISLGVKTDLAEACNRLETARAEALTIKSELLPGAQRAFDTAQIGYRAGKYGYLEVLDTQRTLSEAKSGYLDVLAAYHKAAADVERLTGTPLNTIQ